MNSSAALAIINRYPKNDLQRFFKDAKTFTIDHHEEFLDYLEALPERKITDKEFFAEYCWVIFASGFNAQVVSNKFSRIRKTLSGFDPHRVTPKAATVGLKIIAHKPKWDAIISCAKMLSSMSWDEFKQKYLSEIDRMEQLPRIGPITKFHLARNLGYDVVKPDLHLVRVAEHFGDIPIEALCRNLRSTCPDASGYNLGQIDFCIWCFLSHVGEIQPCCIDPEFIIR